jgi:hypothetical protein
VAGQHFLANEEVLGTVEKDAGERRRSLWANAWNLADVGWIGVCNSADRTEASQERRRGTWSDSGNLGEKRMRTRGPREPASLRGPSASRPLSSGGDPHEPDGRVVCVGGPHDRYAAISDLEQRATDTPNAETAVIEIAAFDEEIGAIELVPARQQLSPQAPHRDRPMKIAYRLPLHTYARRDEVVRGWESRALDGCADTFERCRDARSQLCPVSDYLHDDARHAESTMAENKSRGSDRRVTTQHIDRLCTWEFPSEGRELP